MSISVPTAGAERGHGKTHPSTLSSRSQELTGTEEKNDWGKRVSETGRKDASLMEE